MDVWHVILSKKLEEKSRAARKRIASGKSCWTVMRCGYAYFCFIARTEDDASESESVVA
jgi:hypothetical protein